MLEYQELIQKPSRKNSHKNTQHIERKECHSLIVKKEIIALRNHQLYDNQINRKPCRTSNKRRYQNGYQALAPTLNRTGSHYRWDGTSSP